MRIKKAALAVGLLCLGLIVLTGCTVRTYSQTRDRVDQRLDGNRGYITGRAPAETMERKRTRTTQVVEFEFGLGGAKRRRKTKEMPVEEAYQLEAAPVVASLPVVEPVMEEYKVRKGDTLQKISKKFYGTTRKWSKIYDANRDRLRGPDKIYPGQIINIPLEALKEPKENLK